MKEKLILVFAILCVTLFGCSDKSKNIISDYVFKVDDNTLNETSATFILENIGDNDFTFGEDYFIEKEEDGIWIQVEPINKLIFNMPANILKKGQSQTIIINWEYSYGKLSSGKYRICKNIFNSIGEENIYAYFSIK